MQDEQECDREYGDELREEAGCAHRDVFQRPGRPGEQLRQPVRVSQELGRDVIAIVVVPERRVVAELRRVVRGVVRKRVHFPDHARDHYVADHRDQ